MGTDGSDDTEMREELQAALARTTRKARLDAGFTQEDMGHLLGITSEFYARIERGHVLPSVPTLRKLADVLHMESDVLLGLYAPRRKRRRSSTGRTGGKTTEQTGWNREVDDLDPEEGGYITDPPELRKLARQLRRAHPATIRLITKLLRELERIAGPLDDDDD